MKQTYDDTHHRSRYYDDEYDSSDAFQTNENEGCHAEYNKFSGKYEKPKKKSVFKRILLIFLFVILAFLIFGIVAFSIAYFSIPEKSNFLIMATDKEGTRTDTIMIVSFDKGTEEISVVSIPRDTYVTVSDEMYNQMNASYPEPGSKSMKINTVHHFMGEEKGPEALCTVVEDMLDMNIDYYAKIDFDAFKYIVDSIGGIDFYVPCDMVYSDPYQDLYIDLKEGQQHLNGEQAEQVVRYRSGYSQGDLKRIEVQQNFMKAFFSQALSKKTVMSNPGIYLDMVFKYNYVQTDMGIFKVLSYGVLVSGADTSNMTTQTLPGYPSYAGGQSVYMIDENKLNEITEKLK